MVKLPIAASDGVFASAPTDQEILRFLLGVVLLLVLVPVFWETVRRLIYEAYMRYGSDRRSVRLLEHNISRIELLMLFLLFVGSIYVTTLALGNSFVLEGFALGLGLVLVYSIHLPRLLPPHIHVGFLPSTDKVLPDEKPETHLTLRPNARHTVTVRVANLGVNHIEDCTCWLNFGDGLAPLEYDDGLYQDVHCRKPFELQTSSTVMFAPPFCSLDAGPGNFLLFPVLVDVSETNQASTGINVEFNCKTRSGSTIKQLEVVVVPAG